MTRVTRTALNNLHLVIPGLLGTAMIGAIAIWFYLAGGSVLFLRDHFFPQPILRGVSKIELFNGGRGLGYERTTTITNRERINAITSIVNRYQRDWFDATEYPIFGTDIRLKFFGPEQTEVRSIAIGRGGWETMSVKPDGTSVELYNQMGVSKFSNDVSEAEFSALCKAVSDEFYQTACRP